MIQDLIFPFSILNDILQLKNNNNANRQKSLLIQNI